MIEHLTNEDLIAATVKCLEEIENRVELQEYLTEMSYNHEKDMYDTIYSNETFSNTISDLKKYLLSKMYKIDENKKKRL